MQKIHQRIVLIIWVLFVGVFLTIGLEAFGQSTSNMPNAAINTAIAYLQTFKRSDVPKDSVSGICHFKEGSCNGARISLLQGDKKVSELTLTSLENFKIPNLKKHQVYQLHLTWDAHKLSETRNVETGDFVEIILKTPDITQNCREFRNGVLVAPVRSLPLASDHGHRFFQDEKQALPFIDEFEVSRLGLDYNESIRNKWVSECKKKQTIPQLPYCNHGLETFNYFRALLYGVKNNNWSQKTKELALSKAWSYVDEVRRKERSLLDLVLAVNLLEYGSTEGLLPEVKVDSIRLLKAEIEQENIKLRENIRPGDSLYSCEEIKRAVVEEKNITQKFTKKLNQLFENLSSGNS